MSVFKKFEKKETFLRRTGKRFANIFGNDVFLTKGAEWNFDEDTFTSNPSINGNFLFVEDGKFSIGYAKEGSANARDRILWNMVMSSLSAPWDEEDEKFNVNVSGTEITEAIVISVNPELINNGISERFMTVFTDPDTLSYPLEPDGDGNFNTTSNLVLAPYSISESFENKDFDGFGVSPVWELRTSSAKEFLEVNAVDGTVKVDWSQGTVSSVYGAIFPKLGVILIFPQLLPSTYDDILDHITDDNDYSENTLETLQWIGGFSHKSLDRYIFFLRLRNDEFNHSNNPTAFELDGSSIERIAPLNEVYDGEPTTFITRVGYYNDHNECLAVGFFEYPLQKSELDENIIISQIDL